MSPEAAEALEAEERARQDLLAEEFGGDEERGIEPHIILTED